MSAALSRRGALRGSLAASLGLAAGVAPVLAAPVAVNPDAELIAFAGRVERLAQRCAILADRRSTLEDRITAIAGFGPKAPPEPSSTSGVNRVDDYTTATHRVVTISYPLAEDPAVAEWKAGRDLAREAYESECRAVEARIGLPTAAKRSDRSWGRVHRWVVQLVDMRPQSPAGLVAKAAAAAAIGDMVDGDIAEDESRLALSVCEDVVRLGRGGIHA